MLKPESLKAKPADNYEDLKRQFFALKKLCELKFNQCSAYSRKLAEYDSESLIARNEALESEREMNAQLTAELEKANERVEELEKEQLPIENGKNRYGLDVSYFRNAINRELNRPLSNHKPDELARVLARLSRTADESVMFEPEFSNKFAIVQQIEGAFLFAEYLQNIDSVEICSKDINSFSDLVGNFEQLRKDQSND